MDYSQEMNLTSSTGYAMPFMDIEGKVETLLEYGEQKHPRTGEPFFHHGVDFKCKNRELYAVASGVVSGMYSDRVTGFNLVITYGDYDVIYHPLLNSKVQIGQTVRAGQVVGVSGNFLHVGVKYKDEEVPPMEFLQMIYGNWAMNTPQNPDGTTSTPTFDSGIKTKYDDDQEEILSLFKKFMVPYFYDVSKGNYTVPDDTVSSLQGIFREAKEKRMYFETIPSIMNPLGLGQRSFSLASVLIELLITDFLSYLGQRQRVFLSSATEDEKKNFMTLL